MKVFCLPPGNNSYSLVFCSKFSWFLKSYCSGDQFKTNHQDFICKYVRAQFHHNMNQNLKSNVFLPLDDFILIKIIVFESNTKTKTMKCFPSSAFTQSPTLWWRHLHTFTGEIANSPFCKTPAHITTAHSPSLWNAKLKQTTIHLLAHFETECIRFNS